MYLLADVPSPRGRMSRGLVTPMWILVRKHNSFGNLWSSFSFCSFFPFISIPPQYCLHCGLNIGKSMLPEGNSEPALCVYLVSVHVLGNDPHSLLTNVG